MLLNFLICLSSKYILISGRLVFVLKNKNTEDEIHVLQCDVTFKAMILLI